MAAGGRVIGTVSVKVVPDTTGFRQKLRQELRNAATIDVRIVLEKTSLKKVKKDLEDWRDRISPLKVSIKPELFSPGMAAASARLKWLTRPRTIPILPVLNNLAVAKVATGMATLMAALSGQRVITRMFDKMFNTFKRLDKIAPMLAGIGQGIFGLVGALGAGTSNVLALGVSLASISAVLLTMPGQLAGMAIGLGITFAAFKDFNKVLPEVGQWFKTLQDTISSNFWAKAAEPIRGFFNTLKDQAADGVAAASTSLGSFFGAYATAVSGALDGVLPKMFADLGSSIDIAKTAAEPFANIIRILGQLGAAWLPALAGWFANITTQFSEWLSLNDANGNLMGWVENGVSALKALGAGLRDTVAVLGIMGQVAQENGGATLEIWANTMAGMRAAVSEAGFQEALGGFFRGSHEMMSRIAGIGGEAFKTMIAGIGNDASTMLPLVGTGIGIALAGISEGVSALIAGGGLSDFFAGLNAALIGIRPAMEPIGQMLSMLGTALGVFIGILGPTLGTALSGLAGAFTTLLPALIPILEILGGALGTAITGIMPSIQSLATILATAFTGLAPVLETLGAALGSTFVVLGEALVTLMPHLEPILSILGTVLVAAITTLLPIISELAGILSTAFVAAAPVFEMLGAALGVLLPMFGSLISAALPLIMAVLNPIIGILKVLIPIIMSIAMAILPPVIAAFKELVTALTPFLTIVGVIVEWILGILGPVFVWLAGIIAGVLVGIIGGITSFVEGFMGVFNGFKTMFSGGWDNFWAGIGQVFSGIWDMIVGLFMVFINVGIFGVASKGLALVKGIFTGAWAAIKAGFSGFVAIVKLLWGAFLQTIRGNVSDGIAFIKNVFVGGFNGIKGAVSAGWASIKSTFSSGVSNVMSFVTGLPGKIKGVFSGALTMLKDIGHKIIMGLVNGISGAFGAVKDKLGELTGKLTSWKGPESLDRVILYDAGRLIISGLVNGMESQYDTVRRSLRGLTTDIAATQVAPPQVGSFGGARAAFAASSVEPGSTGLVGGDLNLTIPVSGTSVTPEDIADELLFTIRRLQAGGAYST